LGGPWTQPPELPPLELELVPPLLLAPQRHPQSHSPSTQRSEGAQVDWQKSWQVSGPQDPSPLLPLLPELAPLETWPDELVPLGRCVDVPLVPPVVTPPVVAPPVLLLEVPPALPPPVEVSKSSNGG
jgi:hypothetical protein